MAFLTLCVVLYNYHTWKITVQKFNQGSTLTKLCHFIFKILYIYQTHKKGLTLINKKKLSTKAYESGASSKACCGSVGPIIALQPLTASSLVSTMNSVGPL